MMDHEIISQTLCNDLARDNQMDLDDCPKISGLTLNVHEMIFDYQSSKTGTHEYHM